MSHYEITGLDIESGNSGINPGPAAGYGSVNVSSENCSTQKGGSKRKSRTRKVKRALSKKSKKSTASKSRKNKAKSCKKSIKNKLLHCKKQIQKLNKRINKRRTMKGGAVSNVPLGAESRIPGFSVSAGESYLANPAPFVRTFENNVDNYNHYDGSSHPTNTFDQDVVA